MRLFNSCCAVCRGTPSTADAAVSSRTTVSTRLEPPPVATPAKVSTATPAVPDRGPLMPYTKCRKRWKSTRSVGSPSHVNDFDGGTGGDPGDRARFTLHLPRQHALFKSEGDYASVSVTLRRRDSQSHFALQEQTVIVFDWDDTLFPTSYVNDDLQLDWQQPLFRQVHVAPDEVDSVERRLSLCEERATQILERACALAHVVVVTLASSGWVDLACKYFYPAMGALLQQRRIRIVYAQEKAGVTETHEKLHFRSDSEIERFWGLAKGRAITEEIDKFYSQYEGQSWKNILSIGDSSFERYGLLAATTAYMQGLPLTNESEASVWSPTQTDCWRKVQNGHVKKVRAKCCKLVDQPDVSELTLELEMVSQWLEGMVHLDSGFDLDMEAIQGEAEVEVACAVFNGERPVFELPRLPVHAAAG
mmetsp:Transcript_53199/g.123842  ORF Transcript_53199/g.123842 Transcript_53199/m.123842 type:complete len:419 (+) Transcript_53199:75-1331(+)